MHDNTIVLRDPDPPIFTLADPQCLWPPNHKYVEISLQDSDPIELRDEISSLYLEGAFGRLQDYDSMVAQSSVGLMPSALAFDSNEASVSLLSRATALNVDPISLSMATSNPGALTPQYAGVTVGWKKGGGLFGAPAERGIDVSLSSMMMVRGANQDDFSFLDNATLGSEDRVYNFGLNVGYRGFTLMASYLHGESQVRSSYESYDIGLRYDFGAWATSLAVGGYFGSESDYSYANLFDIDRIYSVEVGASYALRPWLRFQGRFQFFDYRTLYGGPVDGLGGTFYLGTSLGF